MCCEDCRALKLMPFHVSSVEERSSSKGKSFTQLSNEEIFAKYFTCFEGLERISKPYHIKFDNNAMPVIHLPRKIPVLLRGRAQQELDLIESQGEIVKENKSTK